MKLIVAVIQPHKLEDVLQELDKVEVYLKTVSNVLGCGRQKGRTEVYRGRKGTNYVEDSFSTPSQESMLIIKPFLITRNKVSKAIRKTLRNKCKNWIEDYIAEKKDNEIFQTLLQNKKVKIERIVSSGQVTEKGKWLKEKRNELIIFSCCNNK